MASDERDVGEQGQVVAGAVVTSSADTETMPTTLCSWERPAGVTTSPIALMVPVVSRDMSPQASPEPARPDASAR